jgi:hypothetical protein
VINRQAIRFNRSRKVVLKQIMPCFITISWPVFRFSRSRRAPLSLGSIVVARVNRSVNTVTYSPVNSAARPHSVTAGSSDSVCLSGTVSSYIILVIVQYAAALPLWSHTSCCCKCCYTTPHYIHPFWRYRLELFRRVTAHTFPDFPAPRS